MLSGSVSLEIRQSTADTPCLCSVIIGASAEETPELGLTQWLGAGGMFTYMLPCYLGP